MQESVDPNYRITQHLAFDTNKKKLLLLGNPSVPISFSGATAKIKNGIFDHLIQENGVMEVADLINLLCISKAAWRTEREQFNDIIANIRSRLVSDVSKEEAQQVFVIGKGNIRLGKYSEQ